MTEQNTYVITVELNDGVNMAYGLLAPTETQARRRIGKMLKHRQDSRVLDVVDVSPEKFKQFIDDISSPRDLSDEIIYQIGRNVDVETDDCDEHVDSIETEQRPNSSHSSEHDEPAQNADAGVNDQSYVGKRHGEPDPDREPDTKRSDINSIPNESVSEQETLGDVTIDVRHRGTPESTEDDPDTDSGSRNVTPYWKSPDQSDMNVTPRSDSTSSSDNPTESDSSEQTEQPTNVENSEQQPMPSVPTPDEILERNAETYNAKNEDYGDAWRLAGATISMWGDELGIDTVEITDEHNMASLNLYIQRLHKLLRAFNLEFSDQSPENEKPSESHRDGSTYAGIHTSFSMEDE